MNFPPIILGGTIYIGCYFIGALNFSIIASRLFFKQDLRNTGSGNAGFTNLLRLGNRNLAIAVLVLDIARGWLILSLLTNLSFDTYWPFMAVPLLLGNLFPVFHRFRGGKGIATSIGIILAVCPWAALMGFVALSTIIALWKRVSAGSLAFLICAAIAAVVVAPPHVWTLCIFLVFSGIWTHRENIRRLIRGTEPRFTSDSK